MESAIAFEEVARDIDHGGVGPDVLLAPIVCLCCVSLDQYEQNLWKGTRFYGKSLGDSKGAFNARSSHTHQLSVEEM